MSADDAATPLLLLPAAARAGELGALLARRGWLPCGEDSGTTPLHALIDGRADFSAAVTAVTTARRSGTIALVIVAPGDMPRLGELFTAGAGGFLTDPFGADELDWSLRFLARRLTERRVAGRESLDPAAPVGWQRRDPLTGLASAGMLRQRLGEGTGGWLVMVAIVALERTNAAYGRDTADVILREVARRTAARAAERGTDALAGRAAGAEFAILLPLATTEGDVEAMAHRLAGDIGDALPVAAQTVPVSARIGIARIDAGMIDPALLLRRAGAALALAPATGVHRIDPASDEERCAHDLPAALARGEIDVLFQPQIAIADGKITGVEALARWRHGDLGILGAETLLLAAERAGLIAEVSAGLQQRALALASQWPAALAQIRLSINVTAAEIARPDDADRLLGMVRAAGFALDRLTIEITETGLIRDLGSAGQLLSRLRAAGCRVAIDDFGTGYSSLAYLKSLPLDYLKLDKRLVDDIAGSARDRVVVRGVIEMARSLGLAVVAEGVETEEQLALLAAEGCNYYQGFLFSEAVESAALAGLLA